MNFISDSVNIIGKGRKIMRYLRRSKDPQKEIEQLKKRLEGCKPSSFKKPWFLFIFIIFLFIIIYAIQLGFIEKDALSMNFNQYKCNPLFMPFVALFGQDSEKIFSECVFDMQSGVMGHFLAPAYYVMDTISDVTESTLGNFSHMKNFISNFTGSVGEMFNMFFSMFSNTLIGFQKILISVKNLVSKLAGITTVFMHLITTQVKLGQSIHDGPIGDLMRTVCFHPKTIIYLKNGTKKYMKDIKINDVLSNGSIVMATMIIKGDEHNPFYKIYSKQLNKNIFVTGSHKIQDPYSLRFIPVSNYIKAKKTTKYEEKVSCLITDDHLIPIGEYIFWDWED